MRRSQGGPNQGSRHRWTGSRPSGRRRRAVDGGSHAAVHGCRVAAEESTSVGPDRMLRTLGRELKMAAPMRRTWGLPWPGEVSWRGPAETSMAAGGGVGGAQEYSELDVGAMEERHTLA